MLITPLSWLAIRYVHNDLEEDAWSRPARKRRKTPRMGNTLKNGEAHYNSPVVQKRSFPKHTLTFCSHFWCRRVTKLRPDPKLPDPTVPMTKHFDPTRHVHFYYCQYRVHQKIVTWPARRPDHFDPTRRHLWYWNVSDVHIMVIKYILYDGPMWWGGVGAGPAFSVSFVRPPWRLENRSKTFVIDPKVCSRSTISKSFSVTFHSFMSLPHHTLPNHQRKRDTCETLYTNLNLV